MREFFECLVNCNPNRENFTFTVINGEGLGEKALFSNGEVIFLSREDGFLAAHSSELALIREAGIINLMNSLVYAERVSSRKRIIICGAGHVSMPIITLAKLTGFHVTVIDDRELFADNARNAGADLVICAKFSEALSKIHSDSNAYFVVVTRGHSYDSECLRAILKKNYAYVGMMGSHRRGKIVRESLIAEGYDENSVLDIHSPIGLSINAETPEEIAVSILAEIIQIKNRIKNSEFPREILQEILDGEDDRKVLCTIVSKHGAGPRNVGTKMLCTSNGKIFGTIGGGLMEAQVINKSAEMFQNNNTANVLMRFNLNAEAFSQDGEVCGGVIEIFLESI